MRRIICLILCLIMALPLAGCGMISNDWETEAMQDLNQFYREENPEQVTSLPETFALPYYPLETLDPLTCTEGVQQTVSSLVYEGLYALDDTLTPQPLLADSAAYDGTRYTITLRPGVLFSDGTELTARDVVDTLQRAAVSPRYSARFTAVRSITAGSGAVTITLTEPNASFLAMLDIPIVKSGTQDSLLPVGTGPYRVDGSALTANPYYHGAAPALEQITLYACKDDDAVSYAYSVREVHMLCSDLTGSGEEFALTTGDTVDAVSSVMQYVGFHMDHAGLARPEVRQAISLAIERSSIVNTHLLGHGVAARFPFVPTSFRYPTALDTPVSYDDVDAAMAKAGLTTGSKLYHLRILVNSDNDFKVAAAESLAATLSKYDLEVSVRALPWEEYLYTLEKGGWDMYYGETALTPDGDLTALIGTEGVLNYGGYSDPETDALLVAYRQSGAQEDLDKLCRRFTKTCPIAPVCFKSVTTMTARGVVEDSTPTATDPFYRMENWIFHLAE